MSVTGDCPVISDSGRDILRLHVTPDLGPIRAKSLLEHFGSAQAIFSASSVELQAVDGIGPKVARSILHSRSEDRTAIEIERATQCGVRILCLPDDDYPEQLRQIPDPPLCLFVRGELLATDAVSVAIVGTRRCSHYGLEQAARFGELLGKAGLTVISGLARGVDGAAHQGALREGGRTIAVLGNGLSTVYPPEHRELADQICNGKGAVVSELPVDVQPDAGNFPRRNRIITGLSLGVIVIEAGKRSGALITARLASEYNREVFALPGRVDDPQRTAGTNGLIRDSKAKLITCLEDILDELHEVGEIMMPDQSPSDEVESKQTRLSSPALSQNEQLILQAVQEGSEDVDSIALTSGLAIAGVSAALTTLQLKGLIEQLPGNRFTVRKRK